VDIDLRLDHTKKLVGFVSKYVLNFIAKELVKVKYVGFDKNRCG